MAELSHSSRIPHKQAFLATAKLRADGTPVEFSQQDHDSLHLFDRADRFLPNS